MYGILWHLCLHVGVVWRDSCQYASVVPMNSLFNKGGVRVGTGPVGVLCS